MKSFKRVISRHALAALALGCASLASAQELKIGAVNVDKVMQASVAAKSGQSRLQQEFSKKERDLELLTTQFKASVEKFEKDAPTFSETQRAAKQKQLAEQDRELQRRRREFQEDLNLRRNEETQIVIERLNRALKQFAESEKYDLIVQEAAYISPRLDVTEKVLTFMNGLK
jgi:outer membrane protein